MRGRESGSVPNASHWQLGEAADGVNDRRRVRTGLARVPKRWRPGSRANNSTFREPRGSRLWLERIVIHETSGRSPSRVASRVMNVMRTKHNQGDRNGAASATNQSPLPRSGLTPRRSDASADPQRSFERYVMLARAAAASGDTIETERHFQHAEHYFRLMNKTTA